MHKQTGTCHLKFRERFDCFTTIELELLNTKKRVLQLEWFFGTLPNSELYKLESIWTQFLNDYTCTCSCGCESSSDEYVCHNCKNGLCKNRISVVI